MNLLSFGWMMDINKDVFVSSQGTATTPKGLISCKILFTNMFDALMIIWVKYREQWGHTLVVQKIKNDNNLIVLN